MTCDCSDPIVFGCHCTKPWHGEDPRTLTSGDKTLFALLRNAEYDAHPAYRHLNTTRWVMNLDWYKAIRRAFLPPGDDAARDETTWEPRYDDMILGYHITVTEDGGQPHLVDGRAHLRPGEHIIPAGMAMQRITDALRSTASQVRAHYGLPPQETP